MSNQIKTLAEILADMGQSVSANFTDDKKDNIKNTTHDKLNFKKSDNKPLKRNIKKSNKDFDKDNNEFLATDKQVLKKSPKKPKNPAKINIEIKNTVDIESLDDKNLADILKGVEIEPIAVNDKETNRLRWLAFYYLSRRELSQKELRQKLLDKDQDPDKVEALLAEFAEKGYQSDERCATMLIREAVRKGRGKRHIQESFYQHGIDLPLSLDELIAMADVDSLADGTVLDDEADKDEIDWLKLAVEARTKKYGDHVPTDPKEKARQLRFLQYRGFEMDVCFDALKMTLADFDE